jgi:hypothetical protein
VPVTPALALRVARFAGIGMDGRVMLDFRPTHRSNLSRNFKSF